MGHHILRRAINLMFAFLLAVFSVNLSGVLSLQSAYADKPTNPENGTYLPVWCHQTGNHWTIQQGEGERANSWALLMTDSIRNLGIDAVDANVPNGSQVMENNRSDKIDPSYCDAQFTLTAPTPTITGLCGLNNDTVVVPNNSNYTWNFSGWAASKGTVTLNAVSPYTFASDKASVTIPVTETNTAVCIVNDATANVSITPATCNSADVVALASVAHATLTSNGGALDQTVGAHTATFTATAGHAFAGGSTTLAVPYVVAPKLTGLPCAGQQPAAKTQTRVITADPVCSPNGGGTVTSWTEQRTRPYVLSGNSWVLGNWSSWTKVVGSDTTRPATSVECPVGVTPTAPTPSDQCGIYADQYVIPKQTGVRYEVKIGQIGQNEIYAPISDGTYSTLGSSSIKIRAIAKSGYVLTGDVYSWTLSFKTAKCPVTATVTPHEVCGAGDSFTIPATSHVTYTLVTTKWFYFMGVPIFPYINYDTLSAADYPAAGSVTVKAFADAGYEIDGQDTWNFTFDSSKCDQSFSAEGDPIFNDQCGTTNDSYTIEPAEGVTYRVNGDVTPAGFYPNASGSIAITAEASDPNYALTGVTEWSHEFSTASCAAITAKAMCSVEGVVVTLTNEGDTDGTALVNGDQVAVPGNSSTNVIVPLTLWKASVEVYSDNETPLLISDLDCTPGRGGIGGDPQDPPVAPTQKPVPAIATGIVLPQTGSDKNPVVQLVSVIVAGLLAYGMVFALINRRDLISNK